MDRAKPTNAAIIPATVMTRCSLVAEFSWVSRPTAKARMPRIVPTVWALTIRPQAKAATPPTKEKTAMKLRTGCRSPSLFRVRCRSWLCDWVFATSGICSATTLTSSRSIPPEFPVSSVFPSAPEWNHPVNPRSACQQAGRWTCGISVRTGLSAVTGRLNQPRPAATARDDSQARRATLLSRKDRDRVSPEEAVKRMRRYEMMIILDPSLEERTVQPSLDQFLKVVTTAGGSVDKVDVWGRRRLAYAIDRRPRASTPSST